MNANLALHEQIQILLATCTDAIALLTADTAFKQANPAFCQLFGLEPDLLSSLHSPQLLGCHLHDGVRAQCAICQALMHMQPLPTHEIECVIQGTTCSLEISITPLMLAEQAFCALVVRDLTAARKAARMRASFLSLLAHELRSPLNSINGYLDLVLSGVAGELTGQQQEFVRRARAGSEHLYALLEDSLLMARAETDQLRLNREIIQLRDIVDDAVEELELTANDHGVTVEVAIPVDFPRLYADAVRLRQVLRNLLSNALRCTDSAGRVTVSAYVEAVPQSATTDSEDVVSVAQIQVRDTGVGIAQTYLQRVFESGFQVPDEQGRSAGGSGLGLAIVKKIVELHNGSVKVESHLGQGSTFTCTLPGLLS